MRKGSLKKIVSIFTIFMLIAPSTQAAFNQEYSKIDELKKRYQDQTVRPMHCPLSSTGYLDIASKLKSIKNILLECSESASLMDEISTETETIQTSIEQIQRSRDAGEPQTDEDTSSMMTMAAINGQSVADITKVINTVLQSDECSDALKNETFLGATADAIINFSQLGLLIPNANGILVSAGGAAIGSIVKLIDTLLNRGYDFESAEDRNAFIKLNCAFYDLRRELEEADAFKVYAPEHEEDLDETREIISEINDTLQDLTKEYNQEVQLVENMLNARIGLNSRKIKEAKKEVNELKADIAAQEQKLLKGISGLSELKQMVDQQIDIFATPAVTTDESDPAVSQMINKLYQLELVAPLLIEKLKEYTPLSSSKGQDRILIMFLGKLDYEKDEDAYLALQTMEVEKFNKVFRARLLAGLKRVSKDIAGKQSEIDKIVGSKRKEITKKEKMIDELKNSLRTEAASEVKINGKRANVLLSELKSEYNREKAILDKNRDDLKKIESKLQNYVKVHSTRNDDGSSSRIDMSEDFNTIANNIYGVNGNKFIMQSKESAELNLEVFGRMFNEFADKYLVEDPEGKLHVPRYISDELMRRGCQDGKPFIRKFTTARDWKDLGYDFLATNADLFHGFNISGLIFKSKQENIQNHHKSALFTIKKMNGQDVPQDMEKYVGQGFGGVIMEVEEATSKAALIQKFVNTFDCNKVIEMQ